MRQRHALILTLLAAVTGCASPPAVPPVSTPPPSTDGSPVGEFNVIGAEDAPVTIIEFTDLQCPHCARYALQTFPEIRKNYVATGKVRYAARDLPLSFHAFAVPAAVAARCAGEQGRFWEYRDRLFAAQDRLGPALYDELAKSLGLDVARFDACRKDGREEAQVRADARLAQSQGLASTPSFVIGRLENGVFTGETFAGAGSYATFAARIDALIASGL